MTIASLILLIFAGPLLYWAIGAGALLRFRNTLPDHWQVAQIPLLGILVCGLIGPFSLISRISYFAALGVVTALAVLTLLSRRKLLWEVLGSLREFYAYSLLASAAVLLIAFPIPGQWSGDWLDNLRLGQAVAAGQVTLESAGRTVVFGAASLPLTLFSNGLPALQILAAITAAAVASLLRGALRDLALPHAAWSVFLLCISGPFLQHLGFPWAKLLATGCLLAGLFATWRASRGQGSLWPGAFWTAAAVAVHQAAILFIPAILCVPILANQRVVFKTLLAQLATLAVAGIVLVAPYEFWTIREFGWSGKVEQNPAVHYRKPGASLTATTLENLETTFVPQAEPILAPLTAPGYPASAKGIAMRGFFAAVSYVTAVAGTMLLTIAPFLLLGAAYWRGLFTTIKGAGFGAVAMAAAVALAVLGNALLAAYSSPVGMLQTGLTPLSIGGVFLLAIAASRERRTRLRALCAVMVLQTLPWCLLQLGILVGVAKSDPESADGLWQRMLAWDADFAASLNDFGGTLGLRLFPWQLLLLPLALAGAWWLARRDSCTRSSAR